MLGQFVGSAMLFGCYSNLSLLHRVDPPFVDPGHPLHDLFPARVWAIRIPVILALLGSAVVGTFIGIVMINSNKKKAAKAKAAAAKKKT
ncbi:dolichol phosphate-mannose biosynthesis regulatory protein [Penicillium verhagenii]|nr:dolichol phosphate-mannose biosynthesis regulatory protein [Penicillium verhagenii]